MLDPSFEYADSTNEVRLAIKLHGREAKERDPVRDIKHLDIV